MTDNLDPNDLSWLDDPNGQDGDDSSVDWELPSIDMGNPLASRNLSAGDDFAGLFDDLEDSEALPVSDDPATITDEIPSWLQASAPDTDIPMIDNFVPLGQPATSDSEGIPSWLDTQEMAAAPIANKDDVPPWLAEADETSEQAINEAEAEASTHPAVAPGDESSYLPPWLQDADDLGAADANAFESSFDDLDFAVDQQADSGGLSDPFGGIAEPTASDAFGGDIPDWMRTAEQPSIPQDSFAGVFGDMETIPGETTDPLLSNLLQSGGSSGDADLDLLSLLEQTDNGDLVKTGMLAPIEGRGAPPTDPVSDEDFPDFATLMAEPDPIPAYSPILDDPTPQSDVPFDFATLGMDEPLAPSADVSASFDFSQFEARGRGGQDAPPSQPTAPPEVPESRMAPPPLSRNVPSPKPRVADDDFDSFLTSLQDDELGYESKPTNSEPLDLSALLRDPGFGDLEDAPQAVSDTAPMMPEFLRDVSVSQESVAALLRQQKDVPLDELPEELRALHNELAALQQSPLTSETGLPTIPSAPLTPSGARPVTGLSDSQRRGAELLRSLASVTGVATDNADAAVHATQKRTQRRRLGINAIRLLVAACLTAAVVLPFISDSNLLKIGIQPPAVFAPSSTGGHSYDFIESLPVGSLVLVSADYSPGSIAELDALSEPMLRHLFIRGLKPIVIGSDPVTLQHVGRIADELAQGGQRNVDYVIGRYLLGEAVGTQDFVQNIDNLLERDINGLPTGLVIRDFNDFSGIIVLTDRADTVRIWAEQVQSRVRVPLVFAVGAGAGPLSAPYAANPNGRLLVGLRDGITYASQLDAQYPFGKVLLPTPTETPTLIPVTATAIEESLITPSPEGTAGVLESTLEPTVESTEITPTVEVITPTSVPPTSEPSATPSPVPTQPTVEPTVPPTLAPTATQGSGGEATAIPTSSPTTSFVVITGVERVNIRQGPGTTFQIVTSAAPGERFVLLSRADGDAWFEIQLLDDRIGWVSGTRAQIEQGESGLRGMQVGAGGVYQVQNTTRNTERRWSAVSLGAVVAAALIGLGSIVGVFQIILRRRR